MNNIKKTIKKYKSTEQEKLTNYYLKWIEKEVRKKKAETKRKELEEKKAKKKELKEKKNEQ